MGRERMLALFLAGLLAIMAPSAFANNPNISLNASLVDAPEKGWYGSGEVVTVQADIVNDGDATSITVDPSCNEVLRIWNDNNLVIDGTETCLGQSRGLDIDSNSVTQLNSLTWDLRDANGEFVPSGDYAIEYFVAGEELSAMVNVHVQTPVFVPEEVEMIVVASARDGVHAESSPSLITVRLKNTAPEEISLDFHDCAVIINLELYGQCGPEKLRANEIVTISQIPFMPNEGQNEFTISLGDSEASQEFTIDAVTDEDSGINNGDLTKLELELVLQGDSQFDELEIFDPDILLVNNGLDEVSLDFNTSCLGEIWVVDSSGNVVMDSRLFKECSSLDVEYRIDSGTDRIFSQSDWDFIGIDGCHIPPGDLTVVMEIPEHDLYATDVITLTRERDDYCIDSSMSFDAYLSGEDTLNVLPQIISEGTSDLTWFDSCGVATSLYTNGQEIDTWLSQCDNNQTITVQFVQMQLEEIEFDMTNMADGEYTLLFETMTAPIVRSSILFDWPIATEEIVEEIEDEESVEIESRIISGTWSSTTNEIGTCWLLNSPEEGIMTLSGAPGLISWSPQLGATGQYLVHDSSPAPECEDFVATSFTIEEVYSQSMPVEIEEEETEVVASIPVENEEDDISPVVITVGVVASTGILSLLVAAIATNESWRIPATSAGLWLLGLVGRTSETSDGRYQRGRLMGYLTANPGCHFRALMAALEMSNGQITHHLKILEDEGRIWRRPDGRLVRFYPYTSNLHPGVLNDDLPMPPLSPDPNSLQGKILRLLDDDGQMNTFPTQAELAHRLDRSQQLVSHHLRTLQKYGLVQKRKSGLKNRYCLTKEALFLLETTEL